MSAPSAALHSLWGKYGDGTDGRHPILWHLLDTVAVAEELYDGYASASFRARWEPFAPGAGRSVFALCAALHDVGKITPHFVGSVPAAAAAARAAGLGFPETHTRVTHELAGAAWISRAYEQALGKKGARALASAVSVTHGHIERTWKMEGAAIGARYGSDWEAARTEAVAHLAEVLEVPTEFGPLPGSETMLEAAGLIKTSDWVASHPDLFPYTEDHLDVADYLQRARGLASRAVSSVGLNAISAGPTEFEELFGFAPRPGQVATVELSRGMGPEGLVMICESTGAGKTEAALAAAAQFIQAGAAGIYLAMPTQATAHAMYARLESFVRVLDPDAGHPMLNTSSWRNASVAHTERSRWFRGPRRGLLARVGVGTIDQVTASAMPGAYSMVRFAGLAGRVVIFDEVHAFDSYVTQGFLTSLRWLAAAGTPVVVCTATLPVSVRDEIVDAYRSGLIGAPVSEGSGDTGYPSVLAADAAGVRGIALPVDDRARTVGLTTDRDVVTAVTSRVPAGAAHGVVTVVVNSVDASIRTADALASSYPQARVICFHSRFVAADRAKIEACVLEAAGKDSAELRAQQLTIIVGTQVLEQSLDIDADLMVSAIAPIDLLLQRAGRCYRHGRDSRPAWGAEPLLVVTGAEQLQESAYVYTKEAPATLAATARIVQTRTCLRTPGEVTELIETAYDPDALAAAHPDEWDAQLQRINGSADAARNRLRPDPWVDDAWCQVTTGEAGDADYRTRETNSGIEVMLGSAAGEPITGEEYGSTVRAPDTMCGLVREADNRRAWICVDDVHYDDQRGLRAK